MSALRESVIQSQIRLALGMEPDLVLWRNHVGGSSEYDPTRDEMRHHRFGIAPGSPDLVGVLAPSGRWFCLEIKTPLGRLSPAQTQWHALARSRGAFVATVRSPEEAKQALARARTGASE